MLQSLREHFWVARVMEWLPVAGTIALLARSRRAFLLVAAWFAIFVVAKATYVPASVEDASFWRILMPSFPAYLLLTASVVLLVPGVRARPAPESFTLTGRRATIALAAAVAVFAVLPLGVIAATPVLKDGGRQAVIFDNNLLPVSSDVGLQANAANGAVHLSWHAQKPKGDRRLLPGAAREELDRCACAGARAADQCQLYTEPVGTMKTGLVRRSDRARNLDVPRRRVGGLARRRAPRQRLRRERARHRDGRAHDVTKEALVVEPIRETPTRYVQVPGGLVVVRGRLRRPTGSV